VYLGRHLKLKKRVAIKTLHPDVNDHPELVMRFEREALAGAQVSHMNVACATDFGDLEDGTRYLVMEYVRGTNLRDVIDREAPLSAERAVRIARQIAVALGHLHERGIIHRDLKPKNVMLGEGDFVKVVDFGLAKVDARRISSVDVDEIDEDSRLTARGVIFGTIEYLAPEAAFGMELVDARADLYALGVILYEMLSAKHPFDAKTDAELFAKQRHAPAPHISDRAPGVRVPKELEKIVMKLLEKDFDERYQTAAEAIAALDRAVPSASTPPPEPEPPPSIALPSVPPPSGDAAAVDPDAEPGREEAGGTHRPGEDARGAAERTTEKTAKRVEAARARGRSSVTWVALGAAGIVAVAVLASRGGSTSTTGATQTSGAQTSTTAMPTGTVASNAGPSADAAPSADASGHAAAGGNAGPSADAVPSAEAAPSAEVVPSADATASAPSDEAATAPLDVPSFRARMKDDIKGDRWDDLAAATLDLVRASSEVACEKDASAALSSALVALSRHEAKGGDEAWRAAALTRCGPDLLYGFVETGGKSPFAERATKLLREEAVQKVATPALRVAFTIHDGTCPEKLAALDRAVAEGDERAATAIDIQARGCSKNTRAVVAALAQLRARLGPAKH
jgi:serine/threonine-protein kinase